MLQQAEELFLFGIVEMQYGKFLLAVLVQVGNKVERQGRQQVRPIAARLR